MKRILDFLPDWLVALVLGVIFVGLWPILFVIIGIRALFAYKSSDADKIAGAKMAILSLIGLLVLVMIARYELTLRTFFGSSPWHSFLGLVIIGLTVLMILQKIFPNMKWLQKK